MIYPINSGGLITELNDDTCNKHEGNNFAFEKDTYVIENYVKSLLKVIVFISMKFIVITGFL